MPKSWLIWIILAFIVKLNLDMEQNYVETEYDYFLQELMGYVCKGRDAFEDMREEIENSRIYTNLETRHMVEKELKLAEQICKLIEKYWDAE